MSSVPISDAQSRLPELIDKLEPGQEFAIVENGQIVARVTRTLGNELPVAAEENPQGTGQPAGQSLEDAQVSIVTAPASNRSRRRRMAIGAVILIAIGGGIWFAVSKYRTIERQHELARLCDESDSACQSGNYREAIGRANRAIELAPEAALGYARRARARFFLGDELAALADCNEALRRDPNLAVALAYRAPLAGLKDSASAGVYDGERALELDPNLRDGPPCLALAKLKAGDAKSAEELSSRAIELHPEDPEGHRVRGLALAKLKQEGAGAEFNAAVSYSGSQANYLVARAEYFVQLDAARPKAKIATLLELARADAQRAIEASPNFAPAYVALAKVHASEGRWSDVNADCEKAIGINPQLASAYLRAADCLSPRSHALPNAARGPIAETRFAAVRVEYSNLW